jgi:hypothetical protein
MLAGSKVGRNKNSRKAASHYSPRRKASCH